MSVGRGAAVVVVEARRRAVARTDGEDSFIVVGLEGLEWGLK